MTLRLPSWWALEDVDVLHVPPDCYHYSNAPHISGLHLLRCCGDLNASDYRVDFGSRKHVAIIVRNSEIRIYANMESAQCGYISALQCQIGTDVPKLGLFQRTLFNRDPTKVHSDTYLSSAAPMYLQTNAPAGLGWRKTFPCC